MGKRETRPSLPFVPARYYDTLVGFLVERGFAREVLLEGTGVDSARLAADDGYLNLGEVEALVLRCLDHAVGEDIAVAVGLRFQLPSHGALGVAALTAKHIGAALHVAYRYYPLVTPLFELVVRSEGGRTLVRLDARWPLDPRVERFHLAAFCGSLYAQCTFLLGGHLPAGFELDAKHSRPENLPAWVDEIGVVVRFDRPVYEARIPSGLTKLPLPLADAKAHASACKTCDALLAARPDPARFASAVRRQLDVPEPPFPDFDAVARALGTSRRTLRRKLADEGASYRALLDEVRLARADEWLVRDELSITRIGLELGYTDAANFTRAYRRARGMTPNEARRVRRSPLP
jgi:AraC-like DNA-binding protein